ncbi:hypothetical protein [Spirilliplanes yamanashiensis]|uniref:Ribosomally synthesized peptide with SipW-like signal peptide n=1 Tax=Spirilliplanes yamanashiensis TaxID=42233 RepID=A0A8J3Y3G4_9ACTN|nr:hypothetical protein [Spirilliplanes yamanashiensis]MDP9814042.1 hypothetical protein [Spirilliplanes yamanashiensis]GIJ00978.1 hypothetical protein Sya03_03300 [Spirilliplanes yamanashiensis]
MRKMTKRSTAIVATSVLAVGGLAGAAWATGWGVTGVGSASATTAEIKPMRADITVAGNLYPGKSANAVALVDNPNEFPVTLTGMTPTNISVRKGNTDNDACKATLNASSIVVTLPNTAPTIAKDTENQSITVPFSVAQNLSSTCANSTFTLSFNFTGESA